MPVRVSSNNENHITDASPIGGHHLPGIQFLPRAMNIPPWMRKPKDPNWVDRPILSLKFVDDGANADKINLHSEPLLGDGDPNIKLITPSRTQSLLQLITTNAKIKGMCYDTRDGTSFWCVLGRLRSWDMMNYTVVGWILLPRNLPHLRCDR